MDKLAFLIRLVNGIFAGKQYDAQTWETAQKPQGYVNNITMWNPRTFVNGTLRGIDLDVRDDQGFIRQLRIIEQNPNKTDERGALKPFAQQARNGSKICWVIDRAVQQGGFLGRIQDGVWYAAREQAYTNKTYQAAAASPAGVSQDRVEDEVDFNEVPDIPDSMTVADYTIAMLENVADMEPPDFYGDE